MWYVCDVRYAVLYVCVCCFVLCGCAVSRRYIDVCYCDMFSVVNVYLDHLKFCVVCINGRRLYVCCGDLFASSSRTWISLDIASFYEHCQPSSGFVWPACQNTVIGRGRHNLPDRCDSSTAYRLCRLENIDI